MIKALKLILKVEHFYSLPSVASHVLYFPTKELEEEKKNTIINKTDRKKLASVKKNSYLLKFEHCACRKNLKNLFFLIC